MPVTFYAHLTWMTREKAPLIDREVESFLEEFLPRVAGRFGVRTVEIAAPADHVHMLLMLPAVFDAPKVVQALKGASSRIANRDGLGETKLRWANGYDLRSVSPRAWLRVSDYIRKQKQRDSGTRVASLALKGELGS